MISRRQFVGILAGAAAAIAVPELLVPKRTFFLPPPGGWPNDMNRYFTSPYAWYLKMDAAEAANFRTFVRMRLHDDDLAGVSLDSVAHPGSEFRPLRWDT